MARELSSFKVSHVVLPFLLSLLFGVFSGTLVQTQINFLALARIGVAVDLSTKIQTSLFDLANFSLIYIGLFGSSFLISQALALHLTCRSNPALRLCLCASCAALGLFLAFKVTDMAVPMPIFIASTRTLGGMCAMLATAACAGALFAHLSRKALRIVGSVAALFLLNGFLFSPPAVFAQAIRPYKVDTFVQGLESPWSLGFLPDGKALVTEKPGRVRLIGADGKLQSKLVANVPEVFFSGQAGLFDVLIGQDFAQTQRIFLSYACGTRQANHTCVSRARFSEQGLTDVKEIFRSDYAKSGDAHYGGRMAWLPDNTLILAVGDGYTYREEAQNLSNHLGKIVRLNPDGSVPKNNPFLNTPGAKPEIYSYGHRNIQGLVFDAQNNRLLAHEHGPRGGDELNVIISGANYGWPKATYGIDYSGAQISPYTQYEGTQQPAIYWAPSIAPSGMAVYNGDLFSGWKGNVLVGALKGQQVSRLQFKGNTAREQEILFKEVGERFRDIRIGPDGALYLLTDNPVGRVLRVMPQ